MSERDEVDASAAKLLDAVRHSYEEAAGRLPNSAISPPEYFYMDWDDARAWLAPATEVAQLALGGDEQSGGMAIHCQPSVELRGRVADWVADVRRRRDEGEITLFVAATQGRAERTIELLKDYDVFAVPVDRAEEARYAAVLVTIGSLSRGFRLPDAKMQIYAETDVFEEERRAAERRRSATKTFLSDLRDLKVGDFVVHVDHGIGMFVGLKQIGVGDAMQEFLELRYAGDDKLFLPVERLDLVQKYTGATAPPMDKLGGTSWEKAKTRVKMAMRDMAVSSGSACSSAEPEPSHGLLAIGLDEDMARASLRFGLGRFTTTDEIDFAIDTVAAAVERLRTQTVAWSVRDGA